MIIFRADGNGTIGLGHLMRCLSIANELREYEEDITFLLASDSIAEVVTKQGFPVQVLDVAYGHMNLEIEQIQYFAKKGDLFIVDSYSVTKEYFEQLMVKYSVVYLDDVFEIPAVVDYIINYNCYACKILYDQLPVAKHEYLLGTEYAPLRREFRQVPYVVNKQCKKILITTGGADEYNITGQLLERLCKVTQFSDIEFRVVVGALNKHLEELKTFALNHSGQVVICPNVERMSELMQKCDIAISAAGSTLYELCAVGVPTICFSFADNQNRAVVAMKEKKVVCSAGRYHVEGTVVLDRIVTDTIKLYESYEKRQELHDKSKKLVDGQGANRIAKAIKEWYEKGK